MDLLEIFKTYGDPSLGYPSQATLDRIIKQTPDFSDNLRKLLEEPVKALRNPCTMRNNLMVYMFLY